MSSEIMSASDRLDIIDVINRLFIATDARDWETVRHCFTDPVTIDMSSVGAGAAREMKPAEIAGMWETGLSRLKGIHHQAGNYVVTMEGNGATVFCYGIALTTCPTRAAATRAPSWAPTISSFRATGVHGKYRRCAST